MHPGASDDTHVHGARQRPRGRRRSGGARRGRGARGAAACSAVFLVVAVVRTRWVRLHRSPRRPPGQSRLTALRAPRTRGMGVVLPVPACVRRLRSPCRPLSATRHGRRAPQNPSSSRLRCFTRDIVCWGGRRHDQGPSGPGRPPGCPAHADRGRGGRWGGVRRITPGTSRVLTAAWCPRQPRARPCRLPGGRPGGAAAARRGPAVRGPGAPGPRGPRLRNPGGFGGPGARTARRRQRVPGMGRPPPRGRSLQGLWGEEENQRHRDTTRSLSRPRAYQPLWQPCDGGGSLREDALQDKEPHMDAIILMDWYPNIRWINGIAIHRTDGW